MPLITDSGFVIQQATGYDLKILQQPVFSVHYLSSNCPHLRGSLWKGAGGSSEQSWVDKVYPSQGGACAPYGKNIVLKHLQISLGWLIWQKKKKNWETKVTWN